MSFSNPLCVRVSNQWFQNGYCKINHIYQKYEKFSTLWLTSMPLFSFAVTSFHLTIRLSLEIFNWIFVSIYFFERANIRNNKNWSWMCDLMIFYNFIRFWWVLPSECWITIHFLYDMIFVFSDMVLTHSLEMIAVRTFFSMKMGIACLHNYCGITLNYFCGN